MKIRTHFLTAGLVAAGALALTGGPLFAGQTCSRVMHDAGTINRIESKASKLTIVDRHDARLGLHWDQHTRFVMRGKTIRPADLKPGERVVAAYVKTDKDLVARTIRVLPAHGTVPEHSKTAS